MSKDPKLPRHSRETVLAHMAQFHPNCPAEVAGALLDRIVGRYWERPLTVGAAFGIVADNYVRHHLTQYEWLLNDISVPRDEARRLVSPRVKATLKSWGPDTKAQRKAAHALGTLPFDRP